MVIQLASINTNLRTVSNWYSITSMQQSPILSPASPSRPGAFFGSESDDGKHKEQSLSTYGAIILVYATILFVNAFLLTSWNEGLRCVYWNLSNCHPDQSWMLNWLSLGQFHIGVLIIALGWSAHGNPLLEERLVVLVCAMIMSHLASGVHSLDYLNKPMAFVQLSAYLGLLLATLTHTSVTNHSQAQRILFRPNLRQLMSTRSLLRSSSSYDGRRKVQLSTIAAGFLCLLSAMNLLDVTFGKGRNDSFVGGDFRRVAEGADDLAILTVISRTAVTYTLWVTAILGWSIFMATTHQHRYLLVGHAIALFVAQIMLTGAQGEQISTNKARASSLANFLAICVALLGAY